MRLKFSCQLPCKIDGEGKPEIKDAEAIHSGLKLPI